MQNASLSNHWKGFLSFAFEFSAHRTVVKDKQHFGPLVVQRPYYQEFDCPIVLVIHPPGGIAGGDELLIQVRSKSHSKGIVSTPAATKFYRSNQKIAKQTQHVTMESESELEWLPQETLFFDQSYAENTLTFDLLSQESKLMAWDIVGLGRPAREEGYQTGFLKQTLQVKVEGKLCFKDRLELTPDNQYLKEAPGLNAHSLLGTMILFADTKRLDEVMQVLREQAWFSQPGLGITSVNGLVVIRMVSRKLDAVKQVFYDIWTLSRPIVLNKQAVKPRIWNT